MHPLWRKMTEEDLRGMVGLIGAIMFTGTVAMSITTICTESPSPAAKVGTVVRAVQGNRSAVWIAGLIGLWWLLEGLSGKGPLMHTVKVYLPGNRRQKKTRGRLLLGVMGAVELGIAVFLFFH